MAELSLIIWPVGRNKAMATKGSIVFKITHKSKRRLLNTRVKVNLDDYKRGKTNKHLTITNKLILNKKDLYTSRLFELSDRLHEMDIDQIKDYVFAVEVEKNGSTNIIDSLESMAREIELDDPQNTYPALIRATKNLLRKWWGGNHLDFHILTYPELKNYVLWLKQRTHSVNIKSRGKIIGSRQEPYEPNTISIHLRCLRRAFNWAIDNEIIDARVYPFRKFKTERRRNPLIVFDTEHRDLTLEQLQAIRDLDLSRDYRRVQQARDMFMLSFYMVGMNLIDIWNFGWSKVIDNHVQYIRRKTQKGIQFTMCQEARIIIQRYTDQNGNFTIRQRIKSYDGFKAEINKGLKYLGDYIGVPDLTFYAGRHTWSTLAETKCGVPESTVKLALTHGSKTVTGVYINKDREMAERIDDAHRKVLDLLCH